MSSPSQRCLSYSAALAIYLSAPLPSHPSLLLLRHPALHVSESAAAQASWAWPPLDRRGHQACCVTVCTHVVLCVCMGVCIVYACTCHVSAMIACGTTASNPPARHANNKDKPSQTGESAWAGHPIIADRMPCHQPRARRGSARLSRSSLGARSAFSRLLPTAARRYGLGPLFDLHSYAKTTPKASTHHHRLSATVYTPALRGSLAPLSPI